ncbi:MAG: family 10 glycosylhydrolase [Cyanobacteria bacterium J06626_4]
MLDIQGHWAQPCIEYLVQQDIVSGYPDDTFRPEQAITRAEFAAIIGQAFELPTRRSPKRFTDVPPDYWASALIDQIYRAQWLSGFTNDTFRPQQLMPRVQVVVALAAGLELMALHPAAEAVKRTFVDAASIPPYAIAGVAAALEQGLIVSYPQRDRLRPLQPTTRADAAAFVYRALVEQTGIPSVLSSELIATLEPTDTLPSQAERRGVWLTNVDSEVLFSRQNLTAAIERLADCGFNTLYPTVWNGGFTLYPSAIAESVLGERQRLRPRGSRAAEPARDYDMLQACVELAHAQQLQVIPWFEYGFFARQGNTLRPRRPHWFTQQRDGTPIDKHKMEWLNPFHPEVQQFYLALIEELMSRYAVDGFQIDDHFGLPTSFGYDPYTAQRYRAETGRLVPSNFQEARWMRWRANKITDFVTQVGQTVKKHRPQARFSVSPNPPAFSYRNFLQDWPQWLTVAPVDEVIIQTYRWNVASFVRELQKPTVQELRSQVPISIGVLSGLRNRPMPLPILKQQCQAVRANGYAGMAFFFYETLWQPAGEALATREGTFKTLFAATAKS